MRHGAWLIPVIAVMALCRTGVAGAESSLRPDHFRIQTAGNLGLFAVGAGKRFLDEKVEADLLLGHTPEAEAGRAVTTLALKFSYVPGRVSTSEGRGYFGLGLHYTLGEEYRLDDYPDNYYSKFPHSILAHVGWSTGTGEVVENGRFYVEVGTVGHYLAAYYNNPGVIRFDEILSLGFGLAIEY